MGGTSWDAGDWDKYSTKTAKKTTKEIFKSKKIDSDLNPLGVNMREARDSENHPESTPIIAAVDVTGSMGFIAENIVRKGLGVLFNEMLEREPIKDPQLMSMAIGDAMVGDTAPLQVSQFESDITAAKWLEKIYIEGGGGGNGFESYDLAYYFARYHTSTDCFEKRNKKGFLFTVGDEPPSPATSRRAVKKFINKDGDGLESDIPFDELIAQTQKMYHCFHIIIAEGHHAKNRPEEVKEGWRELLGQNAIWLENHKNLAETIVSLIQVTSGEDKNKITKSWGGDTSLVVSNALFGYEMANVNNDNTQVIKF